MRTAALLLALAACSSSPATTSPTDAGGDVTVADASGALFCDLTCGPVAAAADDGATTPCKAGQICGLRGTIPGFQCCTPNDPPTDSCYPATPPDSSSCQP